MANIELLPLDDPRWATYRGGHRTPYNAAPLIRQLQAEGASDRFWDIVWKDLHHQGDVGEATYALVPYLVDHQSRQPALQEHVLYFCAIVELVRTENDNPALPQELELPYAAAFRRLLTIGADLVRHGHPEAVVMGIAATTALAAGHRVLARAYLEFGRLEALNYLRELHGFEPGASD